MTKLIIVDACEVCPYLKMGKPPYCPYSNIDIKNTTKIHKDCKLKDYDAPEDEVHDFENGKSLKEVISGRVITGSSSEPSKATFDGEEEKDEWWGDDEAPVIKTDTSKCCTLCGTLFNGDETTEMDVDGDTVKVHKVCFENIEALVDESDDVDMIKESQNKEPKEENKEELKEDSEEETEEETKEATKDEDDDWDDEW